VPPLGQKSLKLKKIEQINIETLDLIQEHNKRYEFFHDITGEAMRVHKKYHGGLLESAYEAAFKYLLELKGYTVERQVYLPIYWDDIKLDQDYRMDLVINGNIIVELKAINHVDTPHRRQLWNYMKITRLPYGMIINFSPNGLYSEWYHQDDVSGNIEKIKLM
jgi:GxxExxY protein